jgi:hypothetical protein
LNYVAHIDALTNPLIQPHADHATERISMAIQQVIDRIIVAIPGSFQQPFSLISVRPYGIIPERSVSEGHRRVLRSGF